jgi:hypothetical protein
VASAKKEKTKAENVPGRCGASSGHITKLKQSLYSLDINGSSLFDMISNLNFGGRQLYL